MIIIAYGISSELKGKFFVTTLEFVLFNFLLFIFSQYTVEGSVKVTNVVFQSAINHTKIPQLQHYFCQRCSTMYCNVNNLLKLKLFAQVRQQKKTKRIATLSHDRVTSERCCSYGEWTLNDTVFSNNFAFILLACL